ncbi:MAG: hypothetical protein PHQ15_11945 [Methanosarcina sp.]|nr:hypothetical protein [Methanosarcina sp.]
MTERSKNKLINRVTKNTHDVLRINAKKVKNKEGAISGITFFRPLALEKKITFPNSDIP